MKSKLALQVLTVCCSVALLGAYVVYAHRQAQPAAPTATEVAARGLTEYGEVEFEGVVQYPEPTEANAGDRQTIAPSSKLMINVIPRPSFRASPTALPEDEV